MKALKSLRLHIGIFGKVNSGKSSLLNAITCQNVSIVSDMKGTTTDVVEKSMELFPIGPVNFLDTAGLDDESELGSKRVEKTFSILNRTDIALIVTDFEGIDNSQIELIEKLKELNIPYAVVINKTDIQEISENKLDDIKRVCEHVVSVCALKDTNITDKIVNLLLKLVPDDFINSPKIFEGLLNSKDVVILVIPVDKEAPKGRLILPQVQAIRELLDENCISICVKETELQDALKITTPKLVVTDSQAFKKVDEIVPQNIMMTSFSILFARLKGDLNAFKKGVEALETLKPDDKVLILESCTHHNIEDDIARVKIPALIEKKLGFKPQFEYFSGHNFPDIDPYKLIIHCGACMTNRKEVLSRILIANKKNIPITNYGIIISYCLGILNRAIKPFS